MQLLAIAMARCDLPVPVPPTSTALRCWVMNPPPARSLTRVSLMGVPANLKSARSLASGSLAMVSWYLIERACFSLISAVSKVADDPLGFVLAFDGGRHDVVEGGFHAVQPQLSHEVEDLGAFHQMDLCALSGRVDP